MRVSGYSGGNHTSSSPNTTHSPAALAAPSFRAAGSPACSGRATSRSPWSFANAATRSASGDPDPSSTTITSPAPARRYDGSVAASIAARR